MSSDVDTQVSRFVVAEGSTLCVDGKSSLHPLHGELSSGALTGWLRMSGAGGPDGPAPVAAHLEFPITAVSFGNAMYDRELPQRVEADRHPLVTVDLADAAAAGDGHWAFRMRLCVHGVEQTIDQQVHVRADDDSVLVSGQHRLDITRFGLEPPRKLGLRVHPEFDMALEVVGRLEQTPEVGE